MEQVINIYDDDQSSLIIDDSLFNPVTTYNFHNLGETPPAGWNTSNTNPTRYQNASFLEVHVFDEEDKFIITLNSGKPLLLQPSTGKFYFDDYHYHDEKFMVGAKHTPYKHETLEIIRKSQINPIPYDPLSPMSPKTSHKYGIKLSEIFEILKGLPNFTLQKDKKFKIKYAVFGDILLQTAARTFFGDIEPGEEQQEDIPV